MTGLQWKGGKEGDDGGNEDLWGVHYVFVTLTAEKVDYENVFT